MFTNTKFSIHPKIEISAQCPIDGAELDMKSVAIPGMRCFANATCPVCHNDYYVELPVGHAVWCPMILNKTTAEIYSPRDVSWLSKPLKESFLNPINSDLVPKVHKFFAADRIIIINCLDFLYGHSLLRLLNVQRYLDLEPDLACCVLVPSSLVHLVPEGVAEIWEFPIGMKDGLKWYTTLDNWINEQISKRKECFLSPAYSHPSNKIYDLQRFVKTLPDISPDIANVNPLIVLNYREDRLWGSSLRKQQQNIQTLYNQLSDIFPNIGFVLVGFGQKNQIRSKNKARIIDLRTNKLDTERDRLWLSYMNAADCIVGVHGSNMLLPSGLGKSTVELLPRARLSNFLQDILFPHNLQDIREVFFKYRFLYGTNNLDDVKPREVTDVITSIIAYNDENISLFQLGEITTPYNPDFDPVITQAATNYFLQEPWLKNVLKPLKQKIKSFF